MTVRRLGTFEPARVQLPSYGGLMARVRDANRYDVWTNAGHQRPFRIARDISNTAAHQLLRLLQGQGWQVSVELTRRPERMVGDGEAGE
jgi:hypothetical protein